MFDRCCFVYLYYDNLDYNNKLQYVVQRAGRGSIIDIVIVCLCADKSKFLFDLKKRCCTWCTLREMWSWNNNPHTPASVVYIFWSKSTM